MRTNSVLYLTGFGMIQTQTVFHPTVTNMSEQLHIYKMDGLRTWSYKQRKRITIDQSSQTVFTTHVRLLRDFSDIHMMVTQLQK